MSMISNISRVSSTSHLQNSHYEKLATGKKINKAADGAAQAAIAEKIIAEIKGLDKGNQNIGSGQDVLNISDAAMSGVSDYLQRMRELSVQASNTAIMSDSDRQSIQMEIDQLKQGVQDIATQTQYNGLNLLDGSRVSGLQIASDGNGSSVRINQSVNATIDALGIKDFDVTGDFDIGVLDNALDKVSSSRAQMGAQSNRLEHNYNYNSYASYNQNAAESRLTDTDYGSSVSDLRKQQALQNYSYMMQKRQLEVYGRQMQNFTM